MVLWNQGDSEEFILVLELPSWVQLQLVIYRRFLNKCFTLIKNIIITCCALFYSCSFLFYLRKYQKTIKQQRVHYHLAASCSYDWSCRWRSGESQKCVMSWKQPNQIIFINKTLLGSLHHSRSDRSDQAKTSSWISQVQYAHFPIDLENGKRYWIIQRLLNHSSPRNSVLLHPVPSMGGNEIFLVREERKSG